jgi:hypothetical protein
MTKMIEPISSNDKSYQIKFYESIFGIDNLDGNISMNRNSSGYTKGIIFEHKTNINNYGQEKTLSQVLLSLSRFNRDGIPIPAKICLVSQNENKCYIYNTEDYIEYVENVERYANIKISTGITKFKIGSASQIIDFDITSFEGMKKLSEFVKQQSEYTKIHIDVNNVYGWATYYYENATKYKQKPDKSSFFQELKNPIGTLKNFIYPWTGEESDFKYIMDMLNDPQTQKDLGAFYTPPIYAKKAMELVEQAISRVPEGNDYVIIDRCAGTGNLEMYLDDDILSHVIVSTYELREWMTLNNRFGNRVRYIIPPISNAINTISEINEEKFLTGTNALSKDIINNPEVKKYIDNPKCTIILFENPPFVENIQVKKNNGKTIIQKKSSTWKNTEMFNEMKKDISGSPLNDMGNLFIWSGFKYFLRQPTDSYIVFSPIKYWKIHHLISKQFIDGFAFNKKYFHSNATCVTCIFWSNQDDIQTNSIKLNAFNIKNNKLESEGEIIVNKVYSTMSEKYYDNKSQIDDTETNIIFEMDGTLSDKKPIGITPISNDNIIGYLVAYKNTFENPRYSSMLLRGAIYNGHGFYLRKDSFVEKLPCFAASRYTDYCNGWKIMSMVMKSGDKSDKYIKDVQLGRLDDFLFKTMFWTCMTHYSHMRSLYIDGQIYLNELCFDLNNGEKTLAQIKLEEYLNKGIQISKEEQIIYEKMQHILKYIQNNCQDEYNSNFKYGLYQIDEEINVKIQVDTKSNGIPIMIYKYDSLNNMIKELKSLMKNYYINNIVNTLFKYEFLK